MRLKSRIIYGTTEIKWAISTVLIKVISEYKFTSLSALNAVLNLYNIMAIRGEKNPKIYKNNGHTYRIHDANGNKTRILVKARSIYFRLTMVFSGK